MALGRSRRGNSFPAESPFLRFSAYWPTLPYITKKSGPCHAAANITRVQLPGSGATFSILLHFPVLPNCRICRWCGYEQNYRVASRQGMVQMTTSMLARRPVASSRPAGSRRSAPDLAVRAGVSQLRPVHLLRDPIPGSHHGPRVTRQALLSLHHGPRELLAACIART